MIFCEPLSFIILYLTLIGSMKNSSSRCDTPGCNGKVQATCFKCNKLFCFQCSMMHAQQNSGKGHNILELEESIRFVEKMS
jgi:hypothetical protein